MRSICPDGIRDGAGISISCVRTFRGRLDNGNPGACFMLPGGRVFYIIEYGMRKRGKIPRWARKELKKLGFFEEDEVR